MRTLGIVLLLVAACSTNHSNDGSPDAPVDAPPPDGPPVSMLTGTLLGGSAYVPLSGGRVCLVGSNTPCVTTAGDGSWAIEAALDGEFAVSYAGPSDPDAPGSNYLMGIGRAYAGSASGGWDVWFNELSLLTIDEWTPVLADDAGFAFPGGSGGYLVVRVMVDGLVDNGSGASVAISPAAGTGPVYTAGSGSTYTPGLTTTGDDGLAIFGNVPAGFYDVTVTVPGGTCTVSSDLGAGSSTTVGEWAPTTPGTTARDEVIDQAITADVEVDCFD